MSTDSQRPVFFESQYLGADDLNAVVEYGHEQLAYHELGPHTWGIIVGLSLIEAPTPGAPDRRLVTLVPGMAIDGFARAVVVSKRERLSESLFTGIPYDAAVDDPAANGGKPPGRFVRVWIEYQETNARAPAPGFQRCDAGDEFARVQQSYRFVIGDKTGLDERSQVVIAGQAINADQALKNFDSNAAVIEDATVPHQQLPDDNARARWLIPLGWVRWVAYASGGGYFVNRNVVATDSGDDRNRRLRHYAGLSAEAVQAIDGALVLRSRGANPDDPGRFRARLRSAGPLNDTLRDLVWIEGNLRLVGDERIAGGALRFADLNGTDQGTPLSIERTGDRAGTTGGRALDAIIGPEGANPPNRFAVATVIKDDPDPAKRQLGEKLSVLSSGNVGINNATPAFSLHAKGNRVRLESVDGAKSIEMRTDGSQTDLQSATSDLFIRSGGAPTPKHVVINPDAADGNVGIGTATPAHKLDVSAKSIKLGLEGNGGGQLILTNNPGDNKIFLEAFDSGGGGSAAEMLLTGKDGGNAPRITLQANVSQVTGSLGVGTNAPDQALTVVGNANVLGDKFVLENAARTKSILLFTNGSAVDLATTTNDLSIRSPGHHCILNWIAGDGNVGVGTGAPTQKLHVGGNYLRVDGAGGEQAVFGGEGRGAVTIGSLNAAVDTLEVRNLTQPALGFLGIGLLDVSCRNVIEHSDARSKHNVKALSGALDKVMQLRGVSFEWKTDDPSLKTQPRLGVIAQEIQQVVPEAVSVSERGAGVSYSALIPLLIESVKSLKQECDTLRSDLGKLKEELTTLRESKPPAEKRDRKKKD